MGARYWEHCKGLQKTLTELKTFFILVQRFPRRSLYTVTGRCGCSPVLCHVLSLLSSHTCPGRFDFCLRLSPWQSSSLSLSPELPGGWLSPFIKRPCLWMSQGAMRVDIPQKSNSVYFIFISSSFWISHPAKVCLTFTSGKDSAISFPSPPRPRPVMWRPISSPFFCSHLLLPESSHFPCLDQRLLPLSVLTHVLHGCLGTWSEGQLFSA